MADGDKVTDLSGGAMAERDRLGGIIDRAGHPCHQDWRDFEVGRELSRRRTAGYLLEVMQILSEANPAAPEKIDELGSSRAGAGNQSGQQCPYCHECGSEGIVCYKFGTNFVR